MSTGLRLSTATIPGGTYQVLLELKASASEQERKRMAADQLLVEAAVLSRQMEFQQSVEKQQQALMLGVSSEIEAGKVMFSVQ